MMLHIPQVFTREQVAEIRRKLEAADWADGLATAGTQAAQVKQNRQLPVGGPLHRELGELVSQTLRRHPMYVSSALPARMMLPMFNRYEGGGHYGNHIDNAIQFDALSGANLRTDVSTTVFFSDPEEYEGGELVVEDNYGAHEVKLAAGDAIVYPATSLHRVQPVTRGTRYASFLWAQSMVSDDTRRAMLFNLDVNIIRLRARIGECEETVALAGHYHNLLRQWAQL